MGVICKPHVYTAAHCLPRIPEPDPMNTDAVRVRLRSELDLSKETSSTVLSVDPCSDVAVLESPYFGPAVDPIGATLETYPHRRTQFG